MERGRVEIIEVLAGMLTLTAWIVPARSFVMDYERGRFGSPSSEATVLVSLVLWLGLCAVAFLMWRRVDLNKRWLIAWVGAALVFVQVGIILLTNEVPAFVHLFGFASAGCGAGGLAVAWLSRLVQFSDRCLAVVLPCVAAVGAGMLCAAVELDALIVAAGTMISTCVSAILLLLRPESTLGACGQSTENGGAAAGGDSPLLRKSLRHASARLFASPLLIGFAFGSMGFIFCTVSGRGAADPVATQVMLVGGSAVAGLFLAVGWLRYREFDPFYSFRLCLIVLIASFFPFSGDSDFALRFAFACTALALPTTMVVGTSLLCSIERFLRGFGRSGVALGAAGFAFGLAVGACWAFAVARRSPWGEEMVYLSGLMSIIASFLGTNVLISRDALTTVRMVAENRFPGCIDMAQRLALESSADDGLTNACKRLANEKCLTEREAEVLVILARGHTIARVQDDLYISKGTAVTHRRHIYRKLDIHSKQELLDLVDKYRNS